MDSKCATALWKLGSNNSLCSVPARFSTACHRSARSAKVGKAQKARPAIAFALIVPAVRKPPKTANNFRGPRSPHCFAPHWGFHCAAIESGTACSAAAHHIALPFPLPLPLPSWRASPKASAPSVHFRQTPRMASTIADWSPDQSSHVKLPDALAAWSTKHSLQKSRAVALSRNFGPKMGVASQDEHRAPVWGAPGRHQLKRRGNMTGKTSTSSSLAPLINEATKARSGCSVNIPNKAARASPSFELSSPEQ
mmetsp:Transcript_46277/g.134814  ORF Transcript_46277/g.134814 Transcript_46277/m.134814 type:complete len:252 (+) Transcript_46277:755-1510(+)